MEAKLSAKAKPGQAWKVKSTPITRRYGVRTSGAWQAKDDDRAWPGEVGTVVERRWTDRNGEAVSGLWLEFARGRSMCVELEDLADFVLVRPKALNRKTLAAVKEGLADSAAGRVHDLGSFAQYADTDIEE